MKGVYTEKEIALLKEHTKQIIGFLIPLKSEIREWHTISFGYNKYGNYDYRICFNPIKIYGGMGRTSIALEDDDKSCDYTLDDSYSAPDYMANLCHEWKSVKSKIMAIVEAERSITKSITDFEL